MGGIRCETIGGTTKLAGFYAVGECSSISIHGANRLGGNSLLETIVFGKIVGQQISKDLPTLSQPSYEIIEPHLAGARQELRALLEQTGNQTVPAIRKELGDIMNSHFGVFRTKTEMQTGLEKILSLQQRFTKISIQNKDLVYNQSLIGLVELKHQLCLSEAVARAALLREESRGAHYRSDFVSRDDEHWLVHLVVSLTKERALEFRKEPVRLLSKYPIQERKY